MGIEEARWKPTPLLWLFIILSGTLLFFLNVFQAQYSYHVMQPTVIFESNPLPSEDANMKGFLLKTKGCRLPEMLPMDSTIENFIFPEKPVICNGGLPPLIDSNRTSLYLVNNSLSAYEINDTAELKCCFRQFWRVNPVEAQKDGKVEFSKKCVSFTEDVRVENAEFVKVECSYNKNSIYKDFFSFAPLKSNIPRANEIQDKLNVLILGIDSISRLNFHRQIPKTLDALRRIKSVELLGYNKVGDNTFPNLIPVLTGLNESELKVNCWPNRTSRFDSCPFIWKKFEGKGYETAFGEDASWMGIFNYERRGFKRQPTRYFWDTFDGEAEKQIGNSHRVNVNQCLGAREAYTVLLGYVEKFVESMAVYRRPYFGFFWSSSLSHDLLNKPRLGDALFETFITRLSVKGHLDNTIFIFLSDHGIRWGDIRSTFQGRIEERLPFLHVYLPEWYKEKYPMAYSNLQRNRRRLTTPFDLHRTLEDLIDSQGPTRESLGAKQENKTIRRDYSLLETISDERSCENASISQHWCACQESVEIDADDPIVQEAANFTVDFINDLLIGYADCVTLELDEIVDSHLQTHEEIRRTEHPEEDYTLTLRTRPSDALFEATIRRRKKPDLGQFDYEIVGTISRINLYGQQSLCMSDFHLKLYCFCRRLL